MPNDTEKTVFEPESSKEDRRALATLSHLEKAEIPARPSTLQAIRKVLEKGPQQINVQELINLTRSDPAVFRACVGAINQFRKDNDRTGDLLAALHSVAIESVIQTYTDLVRDFEKLANASISPHELIQYERTALRCAAAQEFADQATKFGHSVDRAIAHAAAYFSELGNTLIAAQFPRLWEMARKKSRKSDKNELGIELKKRLGISPEAIGIHFARQAGIYSEVIKELPLSQAVQAPPDAKLTPLGASIRTGELVADLHEQHGSKEANDAWKTFAPKLEIFIGAEGVEKFTDSVNNSVKNILAELRAIAPQAALKTMPEHLRSKADANKTISRCDPNTSRDIERMYSLLEHPGPSQKALHFLLSEVVPKAGFIGGAIFKLIHNKNSFSCLLRFGPRAAQVYDPTRFFSSWEFGPSQRGVSTLRMELGTDEGHLIDCFMARFNSDTASGVFVLELAPKLDEERDKALAHFNALKCALEDCLRTNHKTPTDPK